MKYLKKVCFRTSCILFYQIKNINPASVNIIPIIMYNWMSIVTSSFIYGLIKKQIANLCINIGKMNICFLLWRRYTYITKQISQCRHFSENHDLYWHIYEYLTRSLWYKLNLMFLIHKKIAAGLLCIWRGNESNHC